MSSTAIKLESNIIVNIVAANSDFGGLESPSVSLHETNKPFQEPTLDTTPDGGLRAWLVVLGGFLDFVIAFGIHLLVVP